MSSREEFSSDSSRYVRDTCLCVRVQRAARALARYFDDALRPVGLTHGQFSLLVALAQAEPPTISEVSLALAMDRTTVTANLKPLERRGLVKVATDKTDKRSRRLILTATGETLLKRAFPVWKAAHAELDNELGLARVGRLCTDLKAIAGGPPSAATAAAAE